jgi:hypothetical protein
MTVLIIVLVAVLAIVIIGGLALSPLLNKKGDVAIARAKELVGADNVKAIEPKAVGMGTEPESAGGLLGLGCLAASDTKIAFVTWQPPAEFVIERSSVTGVEAAAEDPGAASKTTIELTYTQAAGENVIARWRFGRDLVPWLTELGYDWGPDGPPVEAEDESSSST